MFLGLSPLWWRTGTGLRRIFVGSRSQRPGTRTGGGCLVNLSLGSVTSQKGLVWAYGEFGEKKNLSVECIRRYWTYLCNCEPSFYLLSKVIVNGKLLLIYPPTTHNFLCRMSIVGPLWRESSGPTLMWCDGGPKVLPLTNHGLDLRMVVFNFLILWRIYPSVLWVLTLTTLEISLVVETSSGF